MTPYDPSLTIDWADGTYTFRLGIDQLLALEANGDKLYEIFNRLLSKTWGVRDIRETLLQGLIGGGLKPIEATKLVRAYVEVRPWLENHQYALAILGHTILPPEDIKKKAPRVKAGQTLG